LKTKTPTSAQLILFLTATLLLLLQGQPLNAQNDTTHVHTEVGVNMTNGMYNVKCIDSGRYERPDQQFSFGVFISSQLSEKTSLGAEIYYTPEIYNIVQTSVITPEPLIYRKYMSYADLMIGPERSYFKSKNKKLTLSFTGKLAIGFLISRYDAAVGYYGYSNPYSPNILPQFTYSTFSVMMKQSCSYKLGAKLSMKLDVGGRIFLNRVVTGQKNNMFPLHIFWGFGYLIG
jgi:hypothetical protein